MASLPTYLAKRNVSLAMRNCRKLLKNFNVYCHRPFGFTQPASSAAYSAEATAGWISGKGGNTQDNLEELFFTNEVQTLLHKLTGLSLQRVFREGKPQAEAERPYYRLATDEELDHLMKQSENQAKLRLQIPPFVKPDLSKPAVISDDKEISGLDTANMVFIDISPGIHERDRTVVVRQTDGVLREGYREEKDRMNRTYFPVEKREVFHRPLFYGEHLLDALDRGFHVHVLDCLCYQMEPDDVEFVQVSKSVFDDLVSRKHYDELYSTRHFGSFVFYLVLNQNIDGLLLHYLQDERVADIGDLLRLFCICHPKCGISTSTEKPELDLLKEYISKCSKDAGNLELSLQNLGKKVEKTQGEMSL